MFLLQVYGFIGLEGFLYEKRASLEFGLLLGQIRLEDIRLEHLRICLHQALLFFPLIDVKLLQFILFDDCASRLQDPAEPFRKGWLIPGLLIPLLRPVKSNQFPVFGEEGSNGALALELRQFVMVRQADLLSGHAGVADIGDAAVVGEEMLQVQRQLGGFQPSVEGCGYSEGKGHRINGYYY